MSLTKSTDVKNHLSNRHRTEIHLQTKSQADATGFPHDEAAVAAPFKNDSLENPFSTSGRKAPADVTPKSIEG
jgi:hypothetical protein